MIQSGISVKIAVRADVMTEGKMDVEAERRVGHRSRV